MKRYPVTTGIGVLTLVLLSTGACAGRSSSSEAGNVTNPSGMKVEQIVTEDDCDTYEASPGITETEIKLGSSFPDSGPLAAIGEANRGMEAYFESLNDSGGINGRKIKLIGKDDQYDPTKALANIDELLQKDQVFAIVGVQTTGILSAWDRLAAQCVPILASTISSTTSEEREAHPNALDGVVPFASDAYAVSSYLTGPLGNKKVAVIAEAGITADAALRGIKTAVEDNGAELVATETFQVTDPTVQSQITTLAQSGADALVVVAAGTKCPQIFDTVAKSSWRPRIGSMFMCTPSTLMELASPESTDGIVSDTWIRRRVPGDAEGDKYFAAMKKFSPSVDPTSDNAAVGWAQGEIIAEILRRSEALTRLDVINTGLALEDVQIPMTADGVLINTGPKDTAPVETVQILEYDATGQIWNVPAGAAQDSLIDLNGRLEDFE
jgi:branched-chain amino acid transport system substrate-binding protein